MSEKKTKKAYALRDFNDAGTEQSFTKGAELTLEEGVYANYKAAGLVGDEAPEAQSKAAKPAEGGAGKTA